MTTGRGARYLLSGVALAALLAVGVGWYATAEPGARVVDESTAATGWKTIEYQSVRVDIPAGWERSDMGDCEFEFVHWGPPGLTACEPSAGVGFYASATFDPAHLPGVRRAQAQGPKDPDWGGYVDAGGFSVYAGDDDRDVVKAVLSSAGVSGGDNR